MTENPDLEDMLKNIPSKEDDTRVPFKKYFDGLDLNTFSEPQESLEKIEQALEIYPNRRKYMLKKLAEVYERLDQPEKAAEIYEEAIPLRREHKFMEGYIDDYVLGAAKNYFLIWEFDKAEDILKEAIKDMTENPRNFKNLLDNYKNLSKFYRLKLKFDVDDLDKFPEYGTSSKTKPEGDLDKAANILEVALRRIPEEEWDEWEKKNIEYTIYNHLVEVYTEAGNGYNSIMHAKSLVELAEKELERLTQEQETDSESYYSTDDANENLVKSLKILGETLIKFKKSGEGIKAYERAQSISKSAQLKSNKIYWSFMDWDRDWNNLGDIFSDAGLYNEAEQVINKIKDEEKMNRNLAHMFFKKKDFKRAAKLFEGVSSPGEPVACESYYNAGVAYYNNGDYKNARRILNTILKRGVSYRDEAREILDKM